jgi:hypothetical protein
MTAWDMTRRLGMIARGFLRDEVVVHIFLVVEAL